MIPLRTALSQVLEHDAHHQRDGLLGLGSWHEVLEALGHRGSSGRLKK